MLLLTLALGVLVRATELDWCARDLYGHAREWRSRAHLTALENHRPVVVLPHGDFQRTIQLYSFVVPVYRELYSGNLSRFLDQIARQTIGTDRIQVVLVVNNTIEVALNPGDPILLENQRTLRWLHQMRERLPFRLDVVDETRGFDRNMGRLRNRAADRALDISVVPLHRHVLINFDADGTLPPDHLERLDAYYSRFDLAAVIARRGHTVPAFANARYFAAAGISEYNHQHFDVLNTMTFPSEGFSTPQISVRADVFRDLGGFADLRSNEDVDFGYRLTERRVIFPPDVLIAQSDRVRGDGFAAANRARWIRRMIDPEGELRRPTLPTTSSFVMAREFSTRLSHRLERRVNQRLISATEALTTFERQAASAFVNMKFDDGFFDQQTIEDMATRVRRINSLVRSRLVSSWPLFSNSVNKFKDDTPDTNTADYLITALGNYLRSSELARFNDYVGARRALERALTQSRLAEVRAILRGEAPANAPTADVFSQHLRRADSPLRRSILDLIKDRRGQFKKYDQSPATEDQLLRALVERFPDFLDETFADPWARGVQNFRLLHDWFLRAQIDPERYPATTSFIALQRPTPH